MELAAEEERHYQRVLQIRQADLQEAIDAYHGRTTQRQAQPLPARQLPVPAPRRTVPQLPAPIEVSEDGVYWFTIKEKEEVRK
jgi:predicted RNase H-like HicB family nuclease